MPKKKTKKKTAKKSPKKIKRPAAKATSARKTTTKKAKPAAPGKAAKKTPQKPPAEVVQGILLGKVEDYFAHVQVAALTLKAALTVGDTIRIKGHTTDLVQKIESLQIDHKPVASANAGEGVGIKVNDRCRKGDRVYKI